MLSYDAPMAANNGPRDAPSSLPNVSGPKGVPASDANSHRADSSSNKHHHIWLVTGPAGCGKSTVAEHLAKKLNVPYVEGDSYHTDANVEKMRNGIPLTDADRWDWLTALRDESMKRIASGAEGVVLTCSALKRKYRDVIRVAAYYDPSLLIHFIYLDATEEVLLERVTRRQNHYMGANMVHSQFDILERPSDDERDVVSIDVSKTVDEVKADALARVLQTMNEDENNGPSS